MDNALTGLLLPLLLGDLELAECWQRREHRRPNPARVLTLRVVPALTPLPRAQVRHDAHVRPGESTLVVGQGLSTKPQLCVNEGVINIPSQNPDLCVYVQSWPCCNHCNMIT